MSDTKTIKSCASQEEAEIFKSLLAANGIRAHIMADDYVGLPLNVSGGVQLQVLEENYEAALKMLERAKTDD